MERVRFLLPDGPDVECLLNPESIQITRTSGARPRPTVGAVTSERDDPVHPVRGGTTRLQMDLLFDVSLTQLRGQVADVRVLTQPLWALARAAGRHRASSRRVHLIWGKQWNVPGDVEALSERLESFTVTGTPRRAWVRLGFIADTLPDVARRTAGRTAP